MKLEHVTLWVSDMEESKAFYSKYFNMIDKQRKV